MVLVPLSLFCILVALEVFVQYSCRLCVYEISNISVNKLIQFMAFIKELAFVFPGIRNIFLELRFHEKLILTPLYQQSFYCEYGSRPDVPFLISSDTCDVTQCKQNFLKKTMLIVEIRDSTHITQDSIQ